MRQLFVLISLVVLPLSACATIKLGANVGDLQRNYESTMAGALKTDHSLIVSGNLNVDDIKFLRSKMMNDDDEWIEELNIQQTIMRMPEGWYVNNDNVFGVDKGKDFEAYLGARGLDMLYFGEGWYYNAEIKQSTLFSYMFYGCKTLRKLVLPYTVRAIGCLCVANCENLEELEIASNSPVSSWWSYCLGAQDIRPLAVCGCPKLRLLILPYYLQTINTVAFCECDALERVVIKNAVCPPAYGYNCFPHPEKLELIVLTDSRSSQFEESPYLSAPGWKDFGSITTMSTNDYQAISNSTKPKQSGEPRIYTVDGRLHSTPPAKGVYIQEGKKRVVKRTNTNIE